jgi:hypothetical protein
MGLSARVAAIPGTAAGIRGGRVRGSSSNRELSDLRAPAVPGQGM